jgi:hypothetical protein
MPVWLLLATKRKIHSELNAQVVLVAAKISGNTLTATLRPRRMSTHPRNSEKSRPFEL